MNVSTMQAAVLDDHAALPGAHQVAFCLHVHGPAPRARFEAAAAALLANYPLLRSTFERRDGAWRRTLHDALPTRLPVETGDLPTLRARFGDLAAAPFDLAAGPPVRFALGVLGPEEHLFLVSIHHVAYDAASIGAVIDLLQCAVGGLPLPTPWRDHAAFVEAERAWLDGPEPARALALAYADLGDRALALPLPVHGPATVQRAAGRRWAAASLATAATSTSPHAALLAAWWLTLADWLHRDDLVLGSTFALRPAPLRDVFGPAFQYVPLAPDIARGAPLADALRAAQAHLRSALRRAWLPLPMLGAPSAVALGLNANLNFYDMDRLPGGGVVVRHRSGAPVFSGDIRITELTLPELPVVRPYDLNLAVFKTGGTLSASLRYRPDLLDGAGAAALLDALAGRLSLAAA